MPDDRGAPNNGGRARDALATRRNVIRLTRDAACINGLSWRICIDGDRFDLLVACLSSLNWSESPGTEDLTIFAVPGGHRMLVVHSTRRLQLRLSYLVEDAARPEVARLVGHVIERALVARVAAESSDVRA